MRDPEEQDPPQPEDDDPPAPDEPPGPDDDDPPAMTAEEFVKGLEPLTEEELQAVGRQAFGLRYDK
jgi:hypothetical protein